MRGLNRDDVIRMAREVSGVEFPASMDGVKIGMSIDHLERFAALVYVEAHKDGLDDFEAVVLPAAIKAEREACIKICEEIGYEREGGWTCADLIRERDAP